MQKMVDLNKRSKKEQRAFYRSQRVTNDFNTGTRTMKTEKNPTRAMDKENFKKMLDNVD